MAISAPYATCVVSGPSTAEFWRRVKTQRCAIVLIADSNCEGTSGGGGWGHWNGLIDGAAANGIPIWGTGLMSAADPTGNPGYLDFYNRLLGGTPWAPRTGAPSALKSLWDVSGTTYFKDSARNFYAYVGSGTVPSYNVGDMHVIGSHPMGVNNALRWSAFVGTNTTGSFQPGSRYENSAQYGYTDFPLSPLATVNLDAQGAPPYTINVDRTLAAYTGAPGGNGDRTIDNWSIGFGTVNVGVDVTAEFFSTFQQVDVPSTQTGLVVSQLVDLGGRHTKNVLDDLLAMPLSSIAHYFNQLRRFMSAPFPVNIFIVEGMNDIGQDALSVDGINWTDQPLGYQSNTLAAIDRLRAGWAYGGFAEPLYFTVVPEHLQDDTATDLAGLGAHGNGLNSFRNQLPSICASRPATTGIDARGLMTAAEWVSNNYYAGGDTPPGHPHQAKAGYIAFDTRMVQALLATAASAGGAGRGISAGIGIGIA
jgi:hypothetical protein